MTSKKTREFAEATVRTLASVLPEKRAGWSWRLPSANLISTGLPDLGVERGYMHLLFGKPKGGKTLLAINAVLSAQSAGHAAHWIDLEHRLDRRAVELGVDAEKLRCNRPQNGEEATVKILDAIDSGADLIVVDSMARMISARLAGARTEADFKKEYPGDLARVVTKAVNAISARLTPGEGPAIIFTNQRRDKIGVLYGSPESIPGGWACKHLISLMMRVTPLDAVNKRIIQKRTIGGKERKVHVGKKVGLHVTLSSLGKPDGKAEVPMLYDSGFDAISDAWSAAALGSPRVSRWPATGEQKGWEYDGREIPLDESRENLQLAWEALRANDFEKAAFWVVSEKEE